MTTEKQKVPDEAPGVILASSAFIGLSASRAAALQNFHNRMVVVITAEVAGLVGVSTWWFWSKERWHFMIIAVICYAARYFERRGLEITNEIAARVPYWTYRLQGLETANGIQGGVQVYRLLTQDDIDREISSIDTVLFPLVKVSVFIWYALAIMSLFRVIFGGP